MTLSTFLNSSSSSNLLSRSMSIASKSSLVVMASFLSLTGGQITVVLLSDGIFVDELMVDDYVNTNRRCPGPRVGCGVIVIVVDVIFIVAVSIIFVFGLKQVIIVVDIDVVVNDLGVS
ncbi:hypothetical protein WICPIJ_007749 [Wickerhamomyces pijperi]|uniref:Transmembrane protein n=1 Tax=Wickerhamomyces pijperi TaxID=599730 RepID=A0A9P8TIY5_WICPI|nr:hypothetical protein WICPIJ_007749 [Wickerhamomyces pijperi]